MKRILAIPVLLLVSACTSTVDVPNGTYGVLLHLGEIKSSASGPATLRKTFFVDHVVLINKEYSVQFDKGPYIIRYEVMDPIKYYRAVGRGTISNIVMDEVAKQSLRENAINSESELRVLIESMKLPIKVLNNVQPVTPLGASSATVHLRQRDSS